MTYACETPERPPIPNVTRFHYNCQPCLVACEAAHRMNPNHVSAWRGGTPVLDILELLRTSMR